MNKVRRGDCMCVFVEVSREENSFDADLNWLGGFFKVTELHSEPYRAEFICDCRECQKTYAVSSQLTRNDVCIDWKLMD